MIADTPGWGSRVFPEIRIRFRSSTSFRLSPRWQAALLAAAIAAVAAFALAAIDLRNFKHLAAKKDAIAARARAANHLLQDEIGGLRHRLRAMAGDRDAAQDRVANLAEETGALRKRLAAAAIERQALDQSRQALQQEKARSAALTAELSKIEADRIAEQAQFTQYKAGLEQTARELAELGDARRRGTLRPGRFHIELGAVWQKLSQLQLPGAPTPVAQIAKPGVALAAPPSGDAAGNAAFVRGDINIVERALHSAGVDVAQLVSKLRASQPQGGPFIPPLPAGSPADADNAEKLAAIRSLAKTLPVSAPLARYEIASPFGPRIDPFNGRRSFHTGIDLDAPYSSPVYATAPGTVIYAGWLGQYGRAVEIDHGFGIVTLYGHLRQYLVSVGQSIVANAEIGLVGSTGRSTGPHVHYEVRVDGQPQDPEKFFGLAGLIAGSGRPLIPAVGGPPGNSR